MDENQTEPGKNLDYELGVLLFVLARPLWCFVVFQPTLGFTVADRRYTCRADADATPVMRVTDKAEQQ